MTVVQVVGASASAAVAPAGGSARPASAIAMSVPVVEGAGLAPAPTTSAPAVVAPSSVMATPVLGGGRTTLVPQGPAWLPASPPIHPFGERRPFARSSAHRWPA